MAVNYRPEMNLELFSVQLLMTVKKTQKKKNNVITMLSPMFCTWSVRSEHQPEQGYGFDCSCIKTLHTRLLSVYLYKAYSHG